MIAKSLSISHTTVGELVRRFNTSNLIWPLPEGMDESTLETNLYPLKSSKTNAKMDMECIQKELRQKGVTLYLLWQEYKETNPEGLQHSQFCERYRQWKKTIDVLDSQKFLRIKKTFLQLG